MECGVGHEASGVWEFVRYSHHGGGSLGVVAPANESASEVWMAGFCPTVTSIEAPIIKAL